MNKKVISILILFILYIFMQNKIALDNTKDVKSKEVKTYSIERPLSDNIENKTTNLEKESTNLLKNYGLQIHAKVIPVNSSTLSSRIDATVEKIYVKEGEYFKKNQKLLSFDCTLLNSEAEKFKAQAEDAKNRYESNLKLFNLNGLDKVELSKSKAEYRASHAEYKVKDQLTKYCTVRAPFAGQMTDIYVHTHETLSRGDNLFKLVDNKDLLVKAFIPSEWVSKVHKGDAFELKVIENNRVYDGKIIRLVKNIDSVSRTMKIIGKLDKGDENLSPGMSGYLVSLK